MDHLTSIRLAILARRIDHALDRRDQRAFVLLCQERRRQVRALHRETDVPAQSSRSV